MLLFNRQPLHTLILCVSGDLHIIRTRPVLLVMSMENGRPNGGKSHISSRLQTDLQFVHIEPMSLWNKLWC